MRAAETRHFHVNYCGERICGGHKIIFDFRERQDRGVRPQRNAYPLAHARGSEDDLRNLPTRNGLEPNSRNRQPLDIQRYHSGVSRDGSDSRQVTDTDDEKGFPEIGD